MSFTYRHRKTILIVLLVLIGSFSSIFYTYNNKKIFKKEHASVTKKKVMVKRKVESKKEEKKEEAKEVKVDVKGEVNSPGLYTLNDGLRVEDAINAAGGLTYNASTEVINLSKKLKDEMVIIVYSKEEVLNFTKTKEEEQVKQDKCLEGNGGIKNDACISDDTQSDTSTNSTVVNLNTATKEELMTVNGIGEAKADAIIKYREEHPFTSTEQLKEVNGIGDSIYDKVKDSFTV